MSQCFPALFFHDHHSQGELAAEGVFGASDLLSDLRCNGVHCWEQLWKRWKSSATHKGRGVGRTGHSLADTFLWTQTDITFDGHSRALVFDTNIFFFNHTHLSLQILMSISFFQPRLQDNAKRNDHSNYWFVVTSMMCIVLWRNKGASML